MPRSSTKPDFRQITTDDVVRMIEEGTAPFQRPWKAGSLHTPYNTTSLRPYHGGNAFHLMAQMLRQGWTDPRFVTYNQAAEKGWQVRKGEHGTKIEYWEFPAGRAPDAGEAEDERKPFVIHRIYTVFNAAQVDGLPELEMPDRNEWEVIEEGERILANSGADIRHDGGTRAFYRPSSDSIHLPVKEAFNGPQGYYPTALHELAHWTGHSSRLDRLGRFPFGSPDYAREELRAELAGLFLAARRGLPFEPQNSAAYMKTWIKPLKDDKNEIFHAAGDAEKAVSYVEQCARGEQPQTWAQREEERREQRAANGRGL